MTDIPLKICIALLLLPAMAGALVTCGTSEPDERAAERKADAARPADAGAMAEDLGSAPLIREGVSAVVQDYCRVEDNAWISDDRRLAVARCEGGSLRVWDVVTGAVRAKIGGVDRLSQVEIARKGGWIAFFEHDPEYTSDPPPDEVRLYDLASGTSARIPQERIRDFAFTPDGERLIVLSTAEGEGVQNLLTQVWSVATRKPIGKARRFGISMERQLLSPDGRYAVAVDESAVTVWDAVTGEQRASYSETGISDETEDHGLGVMFDPTGKVLAIPNDDGQIILLDVAAGKTRAVLEAKDGGNGIATLVFSPDGKAVAAGDGAGWISVWNARTGKLRWEDDAADVLERISNKHYKEEVDEYYEYEHEDPDYGFNGGDLTISPDGRVLLDHGMLRWSMADGTMLARATKLGWLRDDLVYAAEGSGVITLTGCPRLLATSDTAETTTKCPGYEASRIESAVLGRDGVLLISTGYSVHPWFRVDLARDQLALGVDLDDNLQASAGSIATDGTTLVSTRVDEGEYRIVLTDLGSGKEREVPVEGFTGKLKHVFFDETGTLATVGLRADPGIGVLKGCLAEARDYTIYQLRQYSLADLQQHAALEVVSNEFFYYEQMHPFLAAVSHTGRFAAIAVGFQPGGNDDDDHRAVHVFDLTEHELYAVVPTKSCECAWAEAMQISPDGQLLACFHERRAIQLCDTSTLKPWPATGGLELPEGRLPERIAFDAQRGRLAVATADARLELWDVASERRLVRLEAGGSPVDSIAFTADGERLIGSDGQGTLWIWDPARAEPLASLPRVGTLSSLSAGSELAVTVAFGEVQIIRLDDLARLRVAIDDPQLHTRKTDDPKRSRVYYKLSYVAFTDSGLYEAPALVADPARLVRFFGSDGEVAGRPAQVSAALLAGEEEAALRPEVKP
jgi:WD40 repeat protein